MDYLQIMGDLDDEGRTRVASFVESLRRETKRLDVVTVMVSQTSREFSDQLNSGNRTGARTIAAGAETSQIERAAHATLALGNTRPIDERRSALSLSIGKNRMGPGNRVVPLEFNGETGEFRVVGESEAAAEATKERKQSDDDERVVVYARRAGCGFKNPTALAKACRGNRQRTLAAVKRQLAPGGGLEWRGTGEAAEIHARA